MEIKEMNVHAYLISSFLSWRREFFRLNKRFLDVQLRRSLRGP
jgi:ribosome biogenesis protein Tsr3